MGNRRRQRGSAIVEFTLAGIASIFLIMCTIQLSIGMWNYHTLAYAVHEATRYTAVKGVNCTKGGNTCSVTVGTIAHKVHELAVGVPEDRVIVTLKTDSGAETVCNPLNSCYSNATVWPPASNHDNGVGKQFTISAKYQYRSLMLIFWPGAGSQRIAAVWLPATSTQTILF